jgi:hypothetical protein
MEEEKVPANDNNKQLPVTINLTINNNPTISPYQMPIACSSERNLKHVPDMTPFKAPQPLTNQRPITPEDVMFGTQTRLAAIGIPDKGIMTGKRLPMKSLLVPEKRKRSGCDTGKEVLRRGIAQLRAQLAQEKSNPTCDPDEGYKVIDSVQDEEMPDELTRAPICEPKRASIKQRTAPEEEKRSALAVEEMMSKGVNLEQQGLTAPLDHSRRAAMRKNMSNNPRPEAKEYDVLAGIGSNKYFTPVMNLFLKNAKDDYMLADVSNVNYIPEQYRQKQIPLERVGPVFADTMMLYTLVSPGRIDPITGKWDPVDMSIFFSTVRTTFERVIEFSATEPTMPISLKSEYSELASKMRKYLDSNPTFWQKLKRHLEDSTGKAISSTRDVYLFRGKFSVNKMDLDSLLAGLRIALPRLAERYIYLHDIDITMDTCGTMDKQVLKKHLENNTIIKGSIWKWGERCASGENEFDPGDANWVTYGKAKGFYNDEDDEQVGKNCLEYTVFDNDGARLRCKLYNKLVETFTIGGSVKDKFGEIIHHFVESPEADLLGDKFKHAKVLAQGITRIEMTVYSFDLNDSLKYKTMLAEHMYKLVADRNLFFEVPLHVQWEQIYAKLKSSMMIFDNTNRIAYAAWWCNWDTKRITGKMDSADTSGKNEHWERKKEHFKALYSFPDRPIYVIELEFIESGDEFRISTENKCFIKPLLINSGKVYLGTSKSGIDRGWVFTYCGAGTLSRSRNQYDYDHSIFAKGDIAFGILGRKLDVADEYIYKVDQVGSMRKEPRGLDKERLPIFERRLLVEKMAINARKELREKTEAKTKEAELAHKAYLDKQKMELIDRNNLVKVKELMSGSACGFLRLVKREWHPDPEDLADPGYVLPADGKVIVNITLIKLESEKSIIMRSKGKFNGISITARGQSKTSLRLFYTYALINWFLTDTKKYEGSRTPIYGFEPIVIDNGVKYYGVAPTFNVPLIRIVFHGSCIHNGYEYPKIEEFNFLPAWETMPKLSSTVNVPALPEISQEELAGVPPLAIKRLEFVRTLKLKPFSECNSSDEINPGTTVIITRIARCEYRKKTRYQFSCELEPPMSKFPNGTLFVSNLGMSKKLQEIDSREPFEYRPNAIVMKALCIETNKETKMKEMRFEIAQ